MPRHRDSQRAQRILVVTTDNRRRAPKVKDWGLRRVRVVGRSYLFLLLLYCTTLYTHSKHVTLLCSGVPCLAKERLRSFRLVSRILVQAQLAFLCLSSFQPALAQSSSPFSSFHNNLPGKVSHTKKEFVLTVQVQKLSVNPASIHILFQSRVRSD